MRSVALTRHGFPFALALLAGALLAPTPVRGVALGNIASQSSLGQPLRVVIPVALSGGETLNAQCLKLVADNTSAGTPQIVTGRVSLDQAATSPRLVVTTANAVNEPTVRLAVQTGCGSTMRRDYVLFLDPPSAESPTMVAMADIDDPPWTRRPREESAPAPRPNWGTPLVTAQPAPAARPAAPAAEPPLPVATAAVPQRELVALVGGSTGGGFIPEASAAAMPAQSMSPQSLPLIASQASRPQGQSSAVTVWGQTWPYAAGVAGAIALTLLGFVLHRRYVMPSWIAPSARSPLKGETQAGAQQPTFAHFGAMTEPAPKVVRSPIAVPGIMVEETVNVSEFDTLLRDIQHDQIDEGTIKAAWKAAAVDAAVDMGADSILKAIEAAERDLQIGAPEPAQLAMDTALDNDLLTIPNNNTPAKR